MNRAEIIEGLKDIYGILYANLYFRKALDLTIIEACLKLLENENDLIDRVLEIIDKWEKHLSNYADGIYVQGQKMMLAHIWCDVLILKGGEQEC